MGYECLFVPLCSQIVCRFELFCLENRVIIYFMKTICLDNIKLECMVFIHHCQVSVLFRAWILRV